MAVRRLVLALATVVLVAWTCVGSASAEHRASRATFNAINGLLKASARTLDDHLASVEVSSKGPYALAFETGGERYRELLRHRNGRWHNLAVVSQATGFRCGFAPQAVIKDLHILRYVAERRCLS
jgi:hypothetical protein